MPQIVKRKGSPNYFARFQVDGRDYVLSTGTRNRSEAQKILRRMLSEKRGTLAVSELFEDLTRHLKQQESEAETDVRRKELMGLRHDMARQLLGAQSEKMALRDAWKAWLESPKKRNPGPSTVQNYKSQWDRFEGWAKKQDIRFLHEINPVRAEEYASDLWKSKVSPNTYNQHMMFLKGLFRVLRNTAGMVNNPWDEIPKLSPERESRRMLTTDELTAVFQTASGNFRFMFGLGIYTGMRLGDVVLLRWDSIHEKDGYIEIVPIKTKRLKKSVRLPIHPVLKALLAELRGKKRGGEYLFPKERALYMRNRSALTKQIQQIFKAAGITTTEEPSNGHRRRAIVRVGFHSLRHSFVSLCAHNRVPQVAIMELVGHGSPAMTALYSHAGDEQKALAITGLPTFKFDESRKPVKKRKKSSRKVPAKA